VNTPLVLVTGFGPFPGRAHNPSGEVAEALAGESGGGWGGDSGGESRGMVEVEASVLPTSFRRAPPAFDALLEGVGRPPRLLLALGVHRRSGFRIERRARGLLANALRPDVDGQSAAEATTEGSDLVCGLDLEALASEVGEGTEERFWVSDEAGGYVCEWIYHHLLEHARERGIPGLFVHVPPVHFTPVPRQVELLRLVVQRALGGAPPVVVDG
jgi:pyroglutamyl-peptidase